VRLGSCEVKTGRMNPTPTTGGTTSRASAPPTGVEDELALLRGSFLNQILLYIEKNRCSRAAAIRVTLEAYDEGEFPELYELQGSISRATVIRWLKAYLDAGRDYRVLYNKYTGRIPVDVPEEASARLLGIMNRPSSIDNRVPLGSALRIWRQSYRVERKKPPVSEYIMRRWYNEWVRDNIVPYTLLQIGEKGFTEKVMRFETQDWTLVKVGELYICDGKVGNNFVINPLTGKKQRPLYVFYYDGASRMPVGWDLAFTENYRVVGSAFRNAIMRWGFVPPYIKSDNGPAFKSLNISGGRVFELEGLYSRAGVERVSWAEPYNAKAKPIERFFGTMDLGFERMLPGYAGSNNQSKPASSHRNEKFLRSLGGEEIYTVDQIKSALEMWIFEVYGMEPHRGIGGRKPLEVWEEGLKAIPEDRRRSGSDLDFLMLDMDVKRVSTSGVKLNGIWYWDEGLLEYIAAREPVRVRYDNMDDRYVLCYNERDEFICRATPRLSQHPLASFEGNLEERGRLAEYLKERKRIVSRVKKEAKKLLELETSNPIIPVVELGGSEVLKLGRGSHSDHADLVQIKDKESCEVKTGRVNAPPTVRRKGEDLLNERLKEIGVL